MSYRPVIANKKTGSNGVTYGSPEEGDTFNRDGEWGDEMIMRKSDLRDANDDDFVSVRFSDGYTISISDEDIVYPCYVKFARITKEEHDANA